MPTSDLLSMLNLITTVLLVPLVSSLWMIQGRLSKIEGQLEMMTGRDKE